MFCKWLSIVLVLLGSDLVWYSNSHTLNVRNIPPKKENDLLEMSIAVKCAHYTKENNHPSDDE